MTLDLTGCRFGRLRALNRVANEFGKTRWRCLCDCGNYSVVRTGDLRSGNTVSCGCHGGRHITHGMRRTRVYRIWANVKSRCVNPRTPGWHRYGGRGITFCKRWLKFENFYEDMGDPPTDKHEIDRIDNDGNYEPGNCRWVTHLENMHNRSHGFGS